MKDAAKKLYFCNSDRHRQTDRQQEKMAFQYIFDNIGAWIVGDQRCLFTSVISNQSVSYFLETSSLIKINPLYL